MSEENVTVNPSENPAPAMDPTPAPAQSAAPSGNGSITLRNGQAVPSRGSGRGGAPGAPARRKHYWWRYLLFFFGGFLACIGVIVGGVAIAGTAMKARDVITMIGQNPDEILQIEYQNQTILNLIQTLTTKKFETLGDIASVTPIVEKTIKNDLNPILKENLHYELNWEEMKIKPFEKNPNSTRPATEYDKNESLGEYIPNALKSGITLASFVDAQGTATGVMAYFLYPKNGDVYDMNNPYSIADFMQENFFQNLMDNLTIGEIVPDIQSNAFLSQMATWGINDFNDEKMKTLTLQGLFTEEDKEKNPLLGKIESWSINDFYQMDTKINDFKICEIINTSEATGLLAAISGNTIAELKSEGFIDTLYLKDIMPGLTTSDGIMYTLAVTKEFKVGDLKNEESIMSLELGQVLTGLGSNSFLKNYSTKTLKELKTLSTADIKLTDIFSTSEINANPILKGLTENPEITVADLSNYETISALSLKSVLGDYGSNQVLDALVAKGATIATLSSTINSLTLVDVVDVGDSNSILSRIANSSALAGVPINELGDHFGEITIGTLLTVDSSSSQIVKSLQNVTLDGLGKFMNEITAKDVIDIPVGDAYLDTTDPQGLYIKTADGWSKVATAAYDEEYEAYLGVDGYVAQGIATVYQEAGAPTSTTHPEANNRDSLYGVRDTKISDSADLINGLKSSLKLKDVVDIDSSSPMVLQSLATTKLDDIPTVLKTLTLAQVIEIDEGAPQILKSLANVTVFGETYNLEYALVNLKFNNYFTEADCQSGILKVLWNSTTPGGDFLLSEVASKINGLKLIDVLEDQIYEKDGSDQFIWDSTHTYKKLKPSWWFLLTEQVLTDFPTEERYFKLREGANYTMNDMGKLVSNMELHMKSETIFNLIEAEFIIVNNATLEKLNLYIPFDAQGRKYGDLTIKEFLETAASLL